MIIIMYVIICCVIILGVSIGYGKANCEGTTAAGRGSCHVDAYLQKDVLLVAPVLAVLADNPRHSEVTMHEAVATSSAGCAWSVINKCMPIQVDRTQDPTIVAEARTKELAQFHIAEIKRQRTDPQRRENRKLYGMKESDNPLLNLRPNLYQ